MLTGFAQVLILALLAAVFIFGALFVGRFLRPQNPNTVKGEAYECGEASVGPGWINFNIRFYLIALIFVIFDVEAALMFPAVAVYKGWVSNGAGVTALIEILIFVAILVVGLVYVWAKKDLTWIKKIDR